MLHNTVVTDYNSRLVVLGIYERFQCGRHRQSTRKHRLLKRLLIALCKTAGLWKPTGYKLLWGALLAMVCLFQLSVYLYCDIAPGSSDAEDEVNMNYDAVPIGKIFNLTASGKPSALKEFSFMLSSIGSAASYLMLIVCYISKIRKQDNCALAPWDAVHDLNPAKLELLVLLVAINMLIFLAVLIDYAYLIVWQDYTLSIRSSVHLTAILCHFISHWLALVGCYVFLICVFALGTLTNDAIRHIRASKGNLDSLIRIHEDLCCVVFETVSAFSPWFVIHWIIYAANIIISLVYVSIEFSEDEGWNKSSVWFFTITALNYLFIFLLPCYGAAYVTSTCGGIAHRVNGMLASEWSLHHPFRERYNIHLFVVYAKERQCVFKIGRITFTFTIAWISFLLASVGLALRFIK